MLVETPISPAAPTPAAAQAPVGARRALSPEMLLRPFVALLLLVSAALAAYAPSLDGQFLWDDVYLVRKNLLIRSPLFCLEVFRHNLFDNESNFYRPTQSLLFLGDYWFWGLNPFGYHLASILIQGLNAFLLFLVLRGVVLALLPPLAPAPLAVAEASRCAGWLALGLSLLWVVHPVHSAAVAYVSGSADSLAMLCCLGAWLACERALASRRRPAQIGWGALAFAGLLLGLCSKEIGGIWLLLFGANLILLRPGLGGRRARQLALAAGLLAVALYVGLRHLPPAPLTPPPSPKMPPRALLMLRALGDYGSLMIYPKELFMERQVFAAPGLDNTPNEALYLSLAIAGVGMLAAFAAGACLPGRGRAMRRFGAGWFLLGYLPVSNLFPLNASVAEHWLYLPSIGFLMFLAGVAVDLPWSRLAARLPARGRSWAPAAAALAVALPALALGARTWSRSFDWLDEVTFYRQTLRDGGDVARARAGLAMSLSRQHDEAGAIALLRQVTERFPHVLTPRINLANALLHQGKKAEAKELLERAAASFPGHDNNPREVVAAVDALDRVDADDPSWPAQRAALLGDASRRHPDMWELVLISLRQANGSPPTPEGVARVAAYAETHWWHAPARFKLGCMEAEIGRTGPALADFQQAARLDVHDDTALAAAAEICVFQNRLGQALVFQQAAVQRRPDSPQQRLTLARLLEQMGEQPQANQQLAMAHGLARMGRP